MRDINEAWITGRLDAGFEDAFRDLKQAQYRTAFMKGFGQKSGLPDRFYGALGRSMMVEYKVHPNDADTLQMETLRRLARCGVTAYLWTFPKQFDWKSFRWVLFREDGLVMGTHAFHSPAEVKDQAFWLTFLDVTTRETA
jgi:hypothetical protein